MNYKTFKENSIVRLLIELAYIKCFGKSNRNSWVVKHFLPQFPQCTKKPCKVNYSPALIDVSK